MALINCPNCGREISDKAKTCIGCGFQFDGEREVEKQRMVCPECGAGVEEMKDMAQRIASQNITVGRKLYTNRIARLHRVLLSSERLLLLQSEQTLADSKNIFKRGNLKAVVENRRDAIDIIGQMEAQISFFQKQFPLKEKAKPFEDNSEPEQ